MKKSIKRVIAYIMVVLTLICAMPTTGFIGQDSGLKANAATNGHTVQDAIAWVRSQVGKSLDYDGVYGAQCVDLIKYYYAYLGCASYARGNGCDYAYNTLPPGWNRYQGVQPQPGDILVYSGTSGNPYGHVAIYEADRVTYHQNFKNQQFVVCVTYIPYNWSGSSYWGVIRPDFFTHTHSYRATITKSPTCTTTGIRTYTCSCGASYTTTIAATNHATRCSVVGTAPTCTRNGYTEGVYCLDCGFFISGHERILALGHNYGKWTVANKATCTETGTEERICFRCGDTESRSAPALGHNYSDKWTIDKNATCDKPGEKSHHCVRCSSKRDVTAIAALGHKYTTTTVKANLAKDGSTVTKCTVCGAVKSKTAIASVKTISLSKTSFTYNGKIQRPSVVVKDRTGKTLKNGTDYTVKYSSGCKNVGQYTVTVTFKGKYSGTKTLTFKIVPKGTSISKLTAGKKQFTAKWSAQTAQTTGYELQYSTSSSMSGAKKVTVGKNKTTSSTVKKLKGKKKYYVRVRTYKTVRVNGKNVKIYSAWSKMRNVKTK